MITTRYAPTVETPLIKALLISCDSTYEIREIEQDIRTLQGLVGGYLEAYSTEHCTFWFNEEGKLNDLPDNPMATYLWWKLVPEMEGKDSLQGPVFVTGLPDEAGDSTPLPEAVIDLYRRIEAARRDTEGN